MTDSALRVPPVPTDGDAPVAATVLRHLRQLVVTGALEPGTVISQVTLASALGVSRTPLREALRMLQEEGLIQAEPNRQARVTGFDSAELDSIYGSRVTLEAVGVTMTVRANAASLVAELDQVIEEMERLSALGDPDGFHRVHRHFHQLIVGGAPESFRRLIGSQQDRAERYSLMLLHTDHAPMALRDREHREIVEGIRAHDPARASRALGMHLARTALTLMAQLAPMQDASCTRAALAVVTGQLSETSSL